MKYISSYRLFEGSSIRRDESFDSTVKDVLADLIDDDIVVTTNPTPPVYGLSIQSTPIKMGFSTSNLITVVDISKNLLQLISFLEGDYELSSIVVVGWQSGKRQLFQDKKTVKGVDGRSISIKEFCPPELNREEFLEKIFSKLKGTDHYITSIVMVFQRSNESIFNYKLSKDEFHQLHDDKDKTVVLDKYLNDAGRAGRRVYYILFKNSKIGAVKLVYDLNSRKHQNFKVYDNFNNEIEFSKFEVYLMKNNIHYGTFNDAWYYIEDDFNNQGYH